MSVRPQPTLRDGDLVLSPAQAAGPEVAFDCAWRDQRMGRVELLGGDDGEAELCWVVVPDVGASDAASRALRLVTEWAFAERRLLRAEAYVDSEDLPALRAALGAGLKREGLLRGQVAPGGGRRDTVVLARLRHDPPPDSREGFIGMLNSTLPRKRTIAQGLLRNGAGEVLLCELVYKREWDLPGGVVDPGESPAQCVVREVREELGFDVRVHGLVAVDWLPPWRGWDDALLLVFDLGVADSDLLDAATLQPREIRAAHWCPPEVVAERTAGYTGALLQRLAGAAQGGTGTAYGGTEAAPTGTGTAYGGTVYLENSEPPEWASAAEGDTDG